MGIYLNPNNENFTRTTKGKTYVDKTMMISVLNRFMETDNTYLCVSRPQRFGKTIAGNMISAYYSKGCDSRALFAPYKISSAPDFERNLNTLNVIKIDMNSEYQNERDKDKFLDDLQDKIAAEFSAQFPDIAFPEKDSVGNCILKVYAEKGERFVIIIDEYDVLVRENVSQKLFAQYLGYLAYNRDDGTCRIPNKEVQQEWKNAVSAVTQIREKKHFDSLSAYSGNLLFIGVNYDEGTKTHECRIEQFVK